MKTSDLVQHVLNEGGGVIARRDHPELASALDWLVRTDQLQPVLPGVFARPGEVSDPLIRMRAASRRHPNAILVGAAAARLTYLPREPVRTIELACPSKLAAASGFRFTRRRIPPELVVESLGMRCTNPALTSIDLASFSNTDPIDVALRLRVATLDGLYEALRLTSNRTRNPERRRLLIDSRNEPWSAAERESHRVLRRAGITGWDSNWPVVLEGSLYFLDIAFRRQRLALEIDGRIHETDEDLFESDRWRQNALVLDGWRVIRVTWPMVRDHPDLFIATVRRALQA